MWAGLWMAVAAWGEPGTEPVTADDGPPPVAVVREPRAGPRRLALALVGVGSMVAGTVWFFEGGTWAGAGDPAALWMGAGFLGATGAALGAGTRALSQGEGEGEYRVTSPVISTSMSSWGTTTLGETAPPSGRVTLAPRLWVGPRLRVSPSASVRGQLGPAIDVDARPQGGIDPVLAHTTRGIDLSVEARTFLGDGAARSSGWSQLELVARPLVAVRWERFDFLEVGGRRGLQRSMVVPLALGARWNLSERQRYEVIVGPRIDRVAWSDGAGGGYVGAPAYLGPLHMVTRYDIQIPHSKPVLGATARSRLALEYTNSHFDGLGLDFAAVIGYVGALSLEWDVLLQPAHRRWSMWLGAEAIWAEGGGGVFTVGYVPPRGNL